MTPLLGVSNVVQRFQSREHPGCITITATIDDALHFSEQDKAEIIASYKPHEREARVKGVPALGSGRIFPVAEETIACEHREIPPFWPRIGGMDFGWDHPFAAVELAWDRDTDTVYVTRTYRIREATPIIHAAALREWGKSLPWAWPRDGRRETLEGAGKALADQYERQGLDMLFQHSQFEDVSVEAGLAEMLSRMQTGRFKVFKHLNDWFEEFRLYHRRDGKVFKEGDDLMAATRYALMMLRHARSETGYRNSSQDRLSECWDCITMTPNRIWIQVARPGEQYPNGKEGWYRLEGETLLLTTKAGEPIAKRKLAAGENVELVAKRLLLRQSRPKNVDFNRPLRPDPGPPV
jgi:Terminase RNaseH-like domain/Terminase large subunit, T4likevirus-type, N-terminal